MTPPRHTTRFPGERTPAPVDVVEPVEREVTKPYATEAQSLKDIAELACLRQCQRCQQEGGAMHAVAQKMDSIAAKVEEAVKTLNERKGEKRVWGILRPIAVTLWVGAATLTVNHLNAKRAEEQQARQARQAAEVANELKAFRAQHVETFPVQP